MIVNNLLLTKQLRNRVTIEYLLSKIIRPQAVVLE